MGAPGQLILEKELIRGEIKNVLFFHNTDRWYFGDFLRHSVWIEPLAKAGLTITVSTGKDYLEIFRHDPRIKYFRPVDEMSEADFSAYDLVIFPASFPPDHYSPFVKRGIYSYNQAWQYTRQGLVISTYLKDDFNYFRLATPKFGQTYLPDGGYYRIHLTRAEKAAGRKMLDRLFGNSFKKIIIFNPSASNSFTRGNKIKKEVDNILGFSDCARLLDNLLKDFPDYAILIGTSFRAGDKDNFELSKRLGARFADSRVKSITAVARLKTGLSFRAFAAFLADRRTRGMIGNGTGTNTHFAALLGCPALSIERGADITMVNNWKSKDTFQMGSFRWRNPSTDTAAYVLDWSKKKSKDFMNISRIFRTHLQAAEKRWEKIFFPEAVGSVRILAKNILAMVEGRKKFRALLPLVRKVSEKFRDLSVREFYFYFVDEGRYLAVTDRDLAPYMDFLVALGRGTEQHAPSRTLKPAQETKLFNLFKDSNLFKLLSNIAAEDDSKKRSVIGENSVDELIFRKIRAGQTLSPEELSAVRFKDEMQLSKWLNRRLGSRFLAVAKKIRSAKTNNISGSWQQKVYQDYRKGCLLKITEANKQSIYVTDGWTLIGLKDANARAGGLIPHQTSVMKIASRYGHLSQAIRPFIRLTDFRSGKVNREVFGSRSGFMKDTLLSPGWVDEFIDNFLELIRQGIYNIDIKFIDTGLDKFGYFYSVDCGSFRGAHVSYLKDKNIAKDIFYLGLNELLISRSMLAKFHNGRELVEHYDRRIKTSIGLDLSGFSLSWRWGDHANQKMEPYVRKLKNFVKNGLNIIKSRPVYPLINQEMESLVFRLLKERVSKQ